VTGGQVTGRLHADIDVELAIQALQLLGLSPEDAAEVARQAN
jgi:hypothetical protein